MKRCETELRHVSLTSLQLGEVLKRTIKQAALTQEEAATLTGIPRNTLNRKMHGGTFNFDELTRISQVTGVRLSSIIAETEALADKEGE